MIWIAYLIGFIAGYFWNKGDTCAKAFWAGQQHASKIYEPQVESLIREIQTLRRSQ